MLRILTRLLLLALVLVLVVGGLEFYAAESGEVVVLRTTDPDGSAQETRLWVIDDGGHAWLRAGNPSVEWYRNLSERPDVEVVRGSQTLLVRAVPQPDARARVNEQMLDKYGWADRYIGALFGREDTVPIRLDPRNG
jgi:hypothetical protein